MQLNSLKTFYKVSSYDLVNYKNEIEVYLWSIVVSLEKLLLNFQITEWRHQRQNSFSWKNYTLYFFTRETAIKSSNHCVTSSTRKFIFRKRLFFSCLSLQLSRDRTVFKKRKRWVLVQLLIWSRWRVDERSFLFSFWDNIIISMCIDSTMNTKILWLSHLLTFMQDVHLVFFFIFLTNLTSVVSQQLFFQFIFYDSINMRSVALISIKKIEKLNFSHRSSFIFRLRANHFSCFDFNLSDLSSTKLLKLLSFLSHVINDMSRRSENREKWKKLYIINIQFWLRYYFERLTCWRERENQSSTKQREKSKRKSKFDTEKRKC